jgi:hypothetical protein
LTAPFSEEEVRVAVFSMRADKAPESNGFSMTFYQTYWDVVKLDLLSMFADFYHGRLDIAKLNRATICLIPKVSNAVLIMKFRPIGLLNL